LRDNLETARILIERLTDPSYRFEGENPATADVGQARRWRDAYQAVCDYKTQLLEQSRQFADAASPEVGRAIRESDIILLEVQLSRFEQKRDYWKLRVTELNGRRGVDG
jgi:hypothetical protein